jgi:hypothetical protein
MPQKILPMGRTGLCAWRAGFGILRVEYLQPAVEFPDSEGDERAQQGNTMSGKHEIIRIHSVRMPVQTGTPAC